MPPQEPYAMVTQGVMTLQIKPEGKSTALSFHEPRAESLKQELREHGLDGIVQLTSRDVCSDGFCLGRHLDFYQCDGSLP